ncbi:MarR family winged helix-turn-helix transcriptional regulator [Companilactobacillus futsaii]|uniref:MarR family transcriptional regulator n=2 Tax=Companilactobacillus futsaii TaxID=938155 RepID=A0A5B7T5Q7_9LACO|nr:MarR family transcriptional regulator [Companilactobacillus futsaii]KRK98417.1 regulatory protein MarR [Companilactobacillus futsaii JCM 17355]QCX25491.1 MarR family transcriptional regulator [Companilactobacillus futsaii]
MDDYNLVGFVMRYSMVKKRIAAKYLKEEDLNTFESILLGIVYKKKECSQDKIGEITLFDGASIARALKKLEDRGFVSRQPDPNNRRKKIVTITDAGQKLYDEVRKAFHKGNDAIFKDITSEEQTQLEKILIKVYKNLDNIKIESN